VPGRAGKPADIFMSEILRMRKEHEQNLAVVEDLYYTRKEEIERGISLVDEPSAPMEAWGDPASAPVSPSYGWRATSENIDKVNAMRAQEMIEDGYGDELYETLPEQPEAWAPTVPRPFGFEKREEDRKKKLSISQRRLREELYERELIQEQEINQPFVAKPVPPTTFMNVLEDKQRREEDRRRKRKEDSFRSLKHAEFSFMHRDKDKPKTNKYEEEKQAFKAKPVPKTSSKEEAKRRKQLAEIDEMRRQERIKQRADELYDQAKLPSRMEMAEKQKEDDDERRRRAILQDEEEIPYWAEECTFTPAIVGDAPDYEARYRKFEEQLASAKGTRHPTDPEPFNLLTAKINSKDREERILEDIARDNIILKENRWPYVSTRAPIPTSNEALARPRKPLYPGAKAKPGKSKPGRRPSSASTTRRKLPQSTLAADYRKAQTQKLLLERERKKLKDEKAEQARLKRQQSIDKRVSSRLRKEGAFEMEDIRKQEEKERAAERARMKKEERRQVEEDRLLLQAKLEQQPSIWERTRYDAVRMKAQDVIEEIMAQTGVAPFDD